MARNKVLQFEGDIRMWPLNPSTGVRTPLIADPEDIFGNIPIEASAQVFNYEAGDETNITSKRRERYNQTIYSEQQPGQSGMEITFAAIPPALLASVFYGEAADVSVAGAAVTAIPATFTASELSQQLPHTYIAATPAPVVTNVAGDVTYVAGEDYVIDRRLGRIRRIAGGDIGATDEVRLAYTYTSFTLVRIRGGVKPQSTFYIEGDYKNRPDGSDMRMYVYQANLANSGEFDLFSTTPIEVTLAGSLVTPEDKTEPYLVDVINNEAV